MVYYGQDGIVSMMLQKPCDKVHRDLLKGECSFLRRDPIEGCFCVMSKDLVLLTDCTSLDVICYPLAHPCPW